MNKDKKNNTNDLAFTLEVESNVTESGKDKIHEG